VRPFLLKSSSQFRTDGPQALRSRPWANDFNEVKALGSVNSTARTDEQTHIALFWQSAGGPGLTFNAVARNLVDDPTSAVDIADSALLFGMLNLGGADAAINCWNDKYYWDFWRPWQAIREADRDGNPATKPDRSWTALLTAPYPSTRRGTCLDGALLRVLPDVLRHGQDRVRRDKQPLPRRDAPFRQVLGAAQGDHRRPHLGGPALPHCRRAGAGVGPEGRPLHGEHYFQPLD
jgi:hypothetical protein